MATEASRTVTAPKLDRPGQPMTALADRDGCVIESSQTEAWARPKQTALKWTKLVMADHPSSNGYPAWFLYTKDADPTEGEWLGVVLFSSDDVLRTNHGQVPCWVLKPGSDSVFEEKCLMELVVFIGGLAAPSPPSMARLEFIKAPRPPRRKTDTWEVRSTAHGCTEGFIAWYGPWRTYAVNGLMGGDWSTPEMRRIATFLSDLRQSRSHP
jgi:hypothetical protein